MTYGILRRGTYAALWVLGCSANVVQADIGFADDLNHKDILRSNYSIILDKYRKGTMPVHEKLSQIYIPLDELAALLNYYVEQQNDAALIHILDEKRNSLIELNIEQRSYHSNITQASGTAGNELLYEDGQLFVTSPFMATLFNVTILPNRASTTLYINTPMPDISDEPFSMAVPAPVVNASELPPASASIVPHPTLQPSTDTAITDVDVPDDDIPDGLAIAQPVIKNVGRGTEFLEIYHKNQQLYIDFIELSRFLEFYIDETNNNDGISGWYISPDNVFELRFDDKSVRSADKNYTYNDDDIITEDGIVFIRKEAIEAWLPVTLHYNSKWAQLDITPLQELPMQLRASRERLWQRMRQNRNKTAKELVVHDTEHAWLSPPVIDVNIGQTIGSQTGDRTTNYNLQSVGDLAKHSVSTYFGGTDKDVLSNARVTALRKSSDANLLGPLHATEYAMGDINSLSMPLVAQTSLGSGFMVSNRPINFVADFDRKTFIGDATPGWDVELYRNGLLLEFTIVDEDGRYRFDDVPIVFGKNVFRIMLYGPQGQIEERVEIIETGESVLKQGDINYSASFDYKNNDLLGVNNVSPSVAQGFRALGTIDYGLTESLTIGGYLAEIPLRNGEQHRYVGATFNTLQYGVLFNSNIAHNITQDTYAGRIVALGSAGNANYRLVQEMSDGLISEVERNDNNVRTSRSALDINGQFNVPVFGNFNATTTGEYSTFEQSDDLTEARLRIGKPIFGLTTTHGIRWRHSNDDLIDHSLALQGRVGKILWRGQFDTQLKPTSELERFNLVTQYRTSGNSLGRTQITHDFLSKRSVLAQNITYGFNDMRVSFMGDIDDGGNVAFGINLGASFGFAPDGRFIMQSRNMTGGSALESRFYLDENYNNAWDDGEEELSNIHAKINDRLSRNSFVSAIEAYETIRVEPDDRTIEHPLWRSATEGIEYVSLPGQFHRFDFPIVATSEIDGVITIKHSHNTNNDDHIDEHNHPLSDIIFEGNSLIVQLRNDSGDIVNETMSEDDGFYLFQRVLPGKYTIHVASELLENMHLTQQNIPNILIEQTSDFYIDKDIILQANKE